MAKKQRQAQLTFAAVGGQCLCGRCGAPCKVDPVPGSQATMLKRGSEPKGLCINCAVHDTLRNIYPANLILARSAGKTLAYLHIQREFFEIVQMHGTDAKFEEIDWQAIIANWDLPFPTKLRRTATNPVSQEELDREREEGDLRRSGNWKPPLTEQEQRAKDMGELNHATREFLKAVRKEREPDEDPPVDSGDRR